MAQPMTTALRQRAIRAEKRVRELEGYLTEKVRMLETYRTKTNGLSNELVNCQRELQRTSAELKRLRDVMRALAGEVAS